MAAGNVISQIKNAVIPNKGGIWKDIDISPLDWRTAADPPAVLTGATTPQIDATVNSSVTAAQRVLLLASAANGQNISVSKRIPNDIAVNSSGTRTRAQGLRVALDLQTHNSGGDGGGSDTAATGFSVQIICQKQGAALASDPGVFTANWARLVDVDTGSTIASLTTTGTDWSGTIWGAYNTAYAAGKKMLWMWDFSDILDDNNRGVGPGDLLVVNVTGINGTSYGAQHLLCGAFVQYKSNFVYTKNQLKF